MDTANVQINNNVTVDQTNDDGPDDATADALVQKLIQISDPKCDKVMSECSNKAKQIRNQINEILETRGASGGGDDSVDNGPKKTTTDKLDKRHTNVHIDTNTIIQLQKDLELEIIGLNKALNDENDGNKTNDNVVSKNSNNSNNTKDNCSDNTNTGNEKTSIKVKDNINTNVDQKVVTSVKETAIGDKSKTLQTNAIIKESKPEVKTQSHSKNDVKSDTKSSSSRLPSKNGSKYRLSAEQLAKKLSTFSSDADRIAYLKTTLTEVSEDNRSLTQQIKQSDKTIHHVSRERDQIQTEQNRLVLAKSRLENLCRELQRQNKLIKEESLLKIKEEEEKRREIANKFQSTLNEIMSLISDNQKRNTQLKEENADLAMKLKTLMGHYENWERHTEKIIKQKDLETQLMKAKFTKTDLILNQEKQIFIKEKQQLIQMITELQKRCTEMSQSEVKLRTELGVYTNKYEEFQSVLGKSNEMFGGFKKDMERMSKQIQKLEKETQQWKQRWETSNTALLKLSGEKQKRDEEHLKALQKIITLEKLCRAMQGERAILTERLGLLNNESNEQLIQTEAQQQTDNQIVSENKDLNEDKQENQSHNPELEPKNDSESCHQ